MRGRLPRFAGLVPAAACLAGLAGCREEAPPPPVRPVLSLVVASDKDRQTGFAGTIQPRFKADLGFQAGGQITLFAAEVGDAVARGQRLARLDPADLEAQLRSSEADLAKAQSQLANATESEGRIGTLLDQKVASQAEFDTARQERETAAATLKSAQANLDKAREQLSYATLLADLDGVVTEKDAEVGQTVSAGQKVLTVARTDVREAVVDLPENVVRTLAVGAPFAVTLQADPTLRARAKVREIAPQADATTRLFRVRATLDAATEPFRLGATVTAFETAAAPQAALEIPRTAVLEEDGATLVWLIDPGAKTVRTVPVELSGDDGAAVKVAGGLKAGDRIVIAGVHSLRKGQQVKLDESGAP